MTTPKRRSLLSFIFTCLCISKPLLINVKSNWQFQMFGNFTMKSSPYSFCFRFCGINITSYSPVRFLPCKCSIAQRKWTFYWISIAPESRFHSILFIDNDLSPIMLVRDPSAALCDHERTKQVLFMTSCRGKFPNFGPILTIKVPVLSEGRHLKRG